MKTIADLRRERAEAEQQKLVGWQRLAAEMLDKHQVEYVLIEAPYVMLDTHYAVRLDGADDGRGYRWVERTLLRGGSPIVSPSFFEVGAMDALLNVCDQVDRMYGNLDRLGLARLAEEERRDKEGP